MNLVDKYIYYSYSCEYKFDYDNNDLTDQYKTRLNSNHGCMKYIDDANFKKIKEENNIDSDYIIIGKYISPTYTKEGINIEDYSFDFFNKNKINLKILKEDKNSYNYYKTLENVNVIDNYNKIMEQFGFKYNFFPTVVMPYEGNNDFIVIDIISKDYKNR